MNKLSELASEMEQARDKFRNEGQQALKEVFKEYFHNHPIVEKVLWNQYTPFRPYSMIGKPCGFGVNEFELRFYEDKPGSVKVSEDYEGSDPDYTSHGEYYNKDTFQEEHKAAENDLAILAAQCYDAGTILQTVFGDHCMVIATSDGFQVSDCDHD